MKRIAIPLSAFALLLPFALLADGTVRTNPPSDCKAPDSTCGCADAGDDGEKAAAPGGDAGGNHGDDVANGCVKVRLGLGRTTPWTGALACSLKVFADDDAPEIFTAESLHAVLGGYTFKRLGQRNMADGETPAEVVMSHPNGESVTFVFAEGESVGRPAPGVHGDRDERLMMVDAEGWAVASAPVYYDLYVGDGTRRRFLATDADGRLGALVSVTDARGVTNTPAEMGVDIVHTPAGVRQFLTPSRLADVTPAPDWQGYDVAIYALGDDVPAKDPATGLYAIPPGEPVKTLSLRRANGGRRAVVAIRRNASEPVEYVFDHAMGEWSLTRPSGVREERERMVADSRAAQIVSTVREPAGERLSRTETNYRWMSWGFAMTNRVEGFGGVTETTTWTYCTSGNGKGQVRTERRQSGLLTQYAYDAENRVVSETRGGPGMMAEQTTYAYASVDPSDAVPPVDNRPRTVVKTIGGVECRRTYYVYSPLTNIVEQAAEPGAPYGASGALRTVTAFWPASGGPGFVPAAAGFVQSVRHEDGRLDRYGYALSSNLWTRTITHLHELSPEPVDGRTTRDITVTNRRGETLETRTEAFVGGAWRVVARETRAFNAEGRVVRSENLAGQVTATAWDCCHKVSETQPDGSVTTWDYDVEGRVVASSRLIPLDMTNVTWLTTCHEYDGLGRQTATWQTNFAAQAGTPAMRTRHDALGRVVTRVDALDNTTTQAYGPDGLTVTTTAPNGATTILARNASGDTLSITGSAVTPEFHAYGMTGGAGGPPAASSPLLVHTVRHGSASSSRYTKRFENMLGQTVREERSGFRGAVLATTHEYDGYGRLLRTVADGEPVTEYTYDSHGDRIATTHLVSGGAGGSPAIPEFRRTATLTAFALVDGSVWLVSTNVADCSDASIAPLATSTAQQLTGLSAAIPARTHSTDLRGNVTESALRFNAPFSVSVQSPPYAANDQFSVTRYGVELQTVSVSCVTNSFAYDALGRKVATTDGRGNTTRTEYNALGQQTASIDALGNRTEYDYDEFGRLASVTDPLGNATFYEYDIRGNKTYEGGATYPVRYTYDIFGNLATLSTTRDPAANLSTFQPFNFSTASWDTTYWLYDEASGAMTNKHYADGKGPTYDYTPDGRLSRRTWARGITTDYAYDAWGNLTNSTMQNAECRMQNDGGANPVNPVNPVQNISYAYDAMGRQTSAIVDGVSTNFYFYSAYGQVTNEVQNGVSIARTYDIFGRPTGYRLMQNSECRMQNDGGDPSTLQLFNPSTITYSYDSLGRFCGVGFNAEAQSGRVEYGYLPGTDLVSDKSVMVGEGNSAFCILHSALSHEPHRDLIAAVTNAFNPSTLQPFNLSTFAYANDAAGRRVSRLDSFDGETTANTFGYNARSEVTSAIMGTNTYGYAYDPIGNRITSCHNAATNIYTANSLNQYTSITNLCDLCVLCGLNNGAFAYDADGNMTADERGWHYAWNGENRLVMASNDTTVVTYAYDHRGRMVRKDISHEGTETRRIEYLWDNWNIIREIQVSGVRDQGSGGVLVTDNVWGLDLDGKLQGAGGVGGLLAVLRSDCAVTNSSLFTLHSSLYFPTYDANGNISEYVSESGEIVAHYDYSPFGEPLVAAGDLAATFTHQFSTKPYCPVTGFNEYVYRKYRPDIGRWLNRDPIGEVLAINILAFCNNTPNGSIDVIGLLTISPIDLAKALAQCAQAALEKTIGNLVYIGRLCNIAADSLLDQEPCSSGEFALINKLPKFDQKSWLTVSFDCIKKFLLSVEEIEKLISQLDDPIMEFLIDKILQGKISDLINGSKNSSQGPPEHVVEYHCKDKKLLLTPIIKIPIEVNDENGHAQLMPVAIPLKGVECGKNGLRQAPFDRFVELFCDCCDDTECDDDE